jgi:hypothetical protein
MSLAWGSQPRLRAKARRKCAAASSMMFTGPLLRVNNVSSYDPQAHGSVVAFPLEYSPKVNQSMEQVDCYAQLSTNVVDLSLFIKYV